MNDPFSINRYRGCLLGLACGDALGTTLEFKRPGSFEPINDMCGGGHFNLEPGQWTDDTSMALCLAESLLECGEFDAQDQMERYVRWWQTGHLSSNGECFDIGNATISALSRFQTNGNPLAGSTAADTAGNGSIMRLAPVPMFFAKNPSQAIEMSAESSRTTHGATESVDACRYLGALIVGALQGLTKDELLRDRFAPPGYDWNDHPLCATINDIAGGSFKSKEPPAIKGTGYVVQSLEAALWAFHKSTSYREGCLLAVNLGDDADTTGAIYGQLAGAFYGEDGIPQEWREKLALRSTIESMAERLMSTVP